MERPVTIDSTGPTGAIGIEFKPASAYRFFPFPFKEIKNSVVLAREALDHDFSEIQLRISDDSAVERKLALVQGYLLSILRSSERSDPLVEWAVASILGSRGLVRVSDLCDQSGYSKRYLDRRFANNVGVSPKVLARIIRFLPLFRSYLQRGSARTPGDGIPDQYYDRSHFIREFRQFTGRSPRAYLSSVNDFGEIFHRDI